jgi:hypothetical protein
LTPRLVNRGHPLVETSRARRHLLVLAAAALAAFWVEAIAWPLAGGRDWDSYLLYYVQLWRWRPVYDLLMLYRTPLAPLFFGGLLDLGGAYLTEVAAGLCYAVALVALVAALRPLGRRAVIAGAVALLLCTPYAGLYHRIESEPVAALLFALWALLVVRTTRAPSVRLFALNGALVFLLVLARPGNLVFLAFALVALLLPAAWPVRLARGAALLATAGVLLAGWSGYNAVRYDDFTIARDGGQLPLLRAFVLTHIVSPENGPASRKLADAVQRHLLTQEPYRSYHVDLDSFFEQGDFRAFYDLVVLSDRVWGWSSDYSTLRRAGLEAIERHPFPYLHGVARSVGIELWHPAQLEAPTTHPAPPTPRGSVVIRGRRLPKPVGEVLPGGVVWWLASSPDGRVYTDWSSIWNPVERYRTAADARAAARTKRDLATLAAKFPARDGSKGLAAVLNAWSRVFPPMLVWIGVGALALAVRRPADVLPFVVLAGLSLLLIVVTALGQPFDVQYALPVFPAFILFAVAAIVAPRRTAR